MAQQQPPLVFPSVINSAGFDCVKFEFCTYSTPYSTGDRKSTSPITEEEFKKTARSYDALEFEKIEPTLDRSLSVIYLPMPSDINSNVVGNWNGKDLTGLAQVALLTAGKTIGGIITGNGKQSIGGLANLIKPETLKKAGGGLAADAVEGLGNILQKVPGLGANLTGNDLLQLTTGSIVNPNTELLYSGTNLRTHQYDFKLIPQSIDESTSIRNIIKTFQVAAAPKRNAAAFGGLGRNFIGLPNLCKVTYLTKIGNSLVTNEYLPQYKVSALMSVNVSYITDSNFMSYKDGQPVGVALRISLQETKLAFSEDYSKGYGSPIAGQSGIPVR